LNRLPKVLFLPAGVAITLALLACSGFLPLGTVAVFAVAVPAAYVHMRQGPLAGGCVVLVTAGVLVWSLGEREAAAYLVQFGAMSFLLPLFLKRDIAWDRSVGLTLAVLAGAGGLLLAGLSLAGVLDIGAVVEKYLQQELQQVLAMAQQMKLDAKQMAGFETLVRQTVEVFRQIWPAVAVVGSACLQLATLVGLHVLSGGDYRIPGMPMHFWKLPEVLIWGLIGSGVGVLLGGGVVKIVALNVLLIVLACYFLQGLAIICHFFRKNRVPPILRTLGYILVVSLNPLPVIVTGLGVFDLWVDFRKPRKTNE
jgi:uncharacterized protein YybS (DUF2232 family)